MHTFHVSMAPLMAFVFSLILPSYITSPVTSCNATCWGKNEKISTQAEKLSAESTSETISTATASSNQTRSCNETKTEQFCNCVTRICLDPGEYVMNKGKAYVPELKIIYNSSSYEMQEGGCLLICYIPGDPSTGENGTGTKEDPNSQAQQYITLVGLCVSILCLAVHLIAFAMVSELRNMPGWCMACFCATSLSGYVSMLTAADEKVIASYDACFATAASTHFFLLSSLLWMNVMAYDIFKALLNATAKLRVASDSFQHKRFWAYCSYAWGVSLVFVIVAVISDKVEGFPEEYKPHFGKDNCYFNGKKPILVFFAGPMIAVICMNVLFFGRSAYLIVSSGIKSNNTKNGRLRRNLVMYVRLAVIMGLTWITGLLVFFINNDVLLYIFILLNSFQGLFVFLGFTLTSKVKERLLRRFGFVSRKRLMQTSLPSSNNSTK